MVSFSDRIRFGLVACGLPLEWDWQFHGYALCTFIKTILTLVYFLSYRHLRSHFFEEFKKLSKIKTFYITQLHYQQNVLQFCGLMYGLPSRFCLLSITNHLSDVKLPRYCHGFLTIYYIIGLYQVRLNIFK